MKADICDIVRKTNHCPASRIVDIDWLPGYPDAVSSSNPPPQTETALLDQLSKIQSSWPSSEWSWDQRHACATSVLATKAQTEARTQLLTALPHEWTSETLGKATADVRALADLCGGLRPGQLLLSGDKVNDSWAYGLWWPWGDGSAVSIRLGIATGAQPDSKLSSALRTLFAIGA
jgi:hypothetical protein